MSASAAALAGSVVAASVAARASVTFWNTVASWAA